MRKVLVVVCLGSLIGLYAITRDHTLTPPTAPPLKPPVVERDPALELRPRTRGPGIEVTIRDAHDRSVTARAAFVTTRGGLRDDRGERVIPLAERFDDLSAFTTAAAIARRELAKTERGTPAYAELQHQVNTLHDALGRTRLALVQEWSSDALTHVPMSADERQQFTAIVDRQAAAIVAATPPERAAPSQAIHALLGDERYAAYENRRKAFFPAGVHAEEVMP